MRYNPGIFQFREYILLRYLEIIQQNKEISSCDYLFTGDSITQGFDVERFFDSFGKIVNTGILGMNSGMMLHLIDETVLKFNPKRVVYMIGTNDLGETSMTSPKEIANNINLFCTLVLRNIDAEILLISPIPCDERLQGSLGNSQLLRSNSTLQQIYQEMQDIVRDDRVYFLPLFDAFLEDGQLRTELFSDGWHLNDAGYRIYGEYIKRFIEQW